MSRFVLPRQFTVDGNGAPGAGWKLYFYEAGTTTPKSVYADAALSSALANPVVANADGEFAEIFLGGGSYKAVLKTDADAEKYTADGITANGGSVNEVDTIDDLRALTTGAAAAFALVRVKDYAAAGDNGGGYFWWDSTATDADDDGYVIRPDSAPAAGRWVRMLFGQPLIPQMFGAKGDDVTDDATAISAWIAAMKASSLHGYVPAGTYRTSASHNIDDCVIDGAGMALALFKPIGTGQNVFVLTGDTTGCGLSNIGIVEGGTNNYALVLNTCSHTRHQNVAISNFTGSGGAVTFRNSDGAWTESNLLTGFRLVNNKYNFRFSQGATPGTASFGYNKLVNFTVSSMPDDGEAITIDTHASAKPELYHAVIVGNIYLANSATCYALRVEGKLNKSDIMLFGENAGGTVAANAVYIGSAGEFQRNRAYFSFGKANYSKHASGTMTRNQVIRYDSDSDDVFRETNLRDFGAAVSGSGADNVIAPAASGFPCAVFDMTDATYANAYVEFRNAYDYTDGSIKHLKVRLNGTDYKIPLWDNLYKIGGALRLVNGLTIGNNGNTTTERKVTNGTAAPTTGTWAQGDIVYNRAPTAGGYVGWVCVADGTPGTWKTFGAITP